MAPQNSPTKCNCLISQVIDFVYDKIKDKKREQNLKQLVAEFLKERKETRVTKKYLVNSILIALRKCDEDSIFGRKILKRAQFFIIFRLPVGFRFEKILISENAMYSLDENRHMMWIQWKGIQRKYEEGLLSKLEKMTI